MQPNIPPRSEKGQSLAELALSLTILLILLGGLIDSSRLFYSYIALRDAAQEGADYAMYNPNDQAGIINSVITSSSQPIDLAREATVQVTSTAAAPYCQGETISVTVSVRFDITAAFFGAIFGSQHIPLSATSTTTILDPACH